MGVNVEAMLLQTFIIAHTKRQNFGETMGFSGLPLLSPLSPKRNAIAGKASVIVDLFLWVAVIVTAVQQMYTAANFKAVFGHSKWRSQQWSCPLLGWISSKEGNRWHLSRKSNVHDILPFEKDTSHRLFVRRINDDVIIIYVVSYWTNSRNEKRSNVSL